MIVQTPLGSFELVSDGDALVRAVFVEACSTQPAADAVEQQAARQLDEYFSGKRREFTIACHPRGTPFQQRVWAQLERIPYGETTTYGALARQLGNPRAARAVGAACGRNPLWIFVPCHRVVGHHGALTGYAGGVERKRWLLHWENIWTKPRKEKE